MNKSELIQAVATQTGLNKTQAGYALDVFLETIIDAVAQGDSVALAGFGTFKPAHREARDGRNPATGEAIAIAATTLPKFVPGAAFKAKVKGHSD